MNHGLHWREEKGEAEPLILLYLGTRMEALLAINLVAGGAEATKDLQFFLKKLGLLAFIHTKYLICVACVPIGCWEDLISESYTSSCRPCEKQ